MFKIWEYHWLVFITDLTTEGQFCWGGAIPLLELLPGNDYPVTVSQDATVFLSLGHPCATTILGFQFQQMNHSAFTCTVGEPGAVTFLSKPVPFVTEWGLHYHPRMCHFVLKKNNLLIISIIFGFNLKCWNNRKQNDADFIMN